MAQVGAYADPASPSPWTIVVLVDGNYVDNGPYLGDVPNTSEYFVKAGSWQGTYQVSSGTHTVDFQVFSLYDDMYLYQWSDAVTVLAP